MGVIRFLDHPSDVYVEVEADSLEEAYALSGVALYQVMTDVETIEKRESINVEVSGYDLYSLLYNWLEELLYLFDAKGFLGSEVKVDNIGKAGDEFKLKAVVVGEKYDPSKHPSKTGVKAVTYHLMEIEQLEGRCRVRFVLDI